MDGAVTWLAGKALSSLNDLWDLLESTVLSTPDVTTLDQVKQLNTTSIMVVDGSYVLAFLTAGILVMTKDNVQIGYGIGELAPRLAFGAGSPATSLLLRSGVDAPGAPGGPGRPPQPPPHPDGRTP